MKKVLKKMFSCFDVDNKMYKTYKKYHEKKSVYKYSFMHTYYSHKYFKKYNCIISPIANIKGVIHFAHPLGVVIGAGCSIGKNCTIFQNVTIGQKNNLYPTIGDNVTIYPGAVVIGNIKIGNNVVIGANSVVTKDVPDNTVVAGIPAKVIKRVDE